MVNRNDIDYIENISECIFDLIKIFDTKLMIHSPEDRMNIRAKSSYYHTLTKLSNEFMTMKSSTFLADNQILEAKRKVSSLNRLADDTGIRGNKESEIFLKLNS